MTCLARIVGAVGALLALLLGACSARDAGPSPESRPINTPAVSPSPTPTPVPLRETHRYVDGVTLRVSDVTEVRLGPFPVTDDPGAKEGDPYVLLTVTFANGSQARVEFLPTFVARFGATLTTAPQVVTPKELEGTMLLDPGESYEHEVGFLIPEADRGQVVIHVIDALDSSRNLVLAGSLE